jgi:hypothetical protein
MAKRKRKAAPIKTEYVGATPEREARNPTRSAGLSRRIIPMIDILAERGVLNPKEHAILAYYRDQAGLADRSPVRSCCDNSPRGGGHGPGVAIMSATLETARLEREMGSLWELARAVAVDDWSLSRWCIEKFGGRERYDGKGKLVAVVPINEKRHVEVARMELRMAARRIMGVD